MLHYARTPLLLPRLHHSKLVRVRTELTSLRLLYSVFALILSVPFVLRLQEHSFETRINVTMLNTRHIWLLSTLLLTAIAHDRIKRQLSIDDIIHKALALVRPIFDTSQPIQNDAMIDHQFSDPTVSEGKRQQDILGAQPLGFLDHIPLCKGNSKICQFISCEAENFKKDQNFANLNLAAQVLGDRKLRKAVSNNPDAINAVCADQGMSDDQCKLFSSGFQLVDRFITTVEGDENVNKKKHKQETTSSTSTTTTTTEPPSIIQQNDDSPYPPLSILNARQQDEPQEKRVRIEMGAGQSTDYYTDPDMMASFGRQPRKQIRGSKTWSTRHSGNSIEHDPPPILPQPLFPPLFLAVTPPSGPPGHFLFPTVPPAPPLAFPTFAPPQALPTLPPLPTFPTLPPPLFPILSIQPLKGLSVEKPVVQFSKDEYSEVFRQAKDLDYRKRRETNDDLSYDFDDVEWSNRRRVKRDYYDDAEQARRNLGLGSKATTSSPTEAEDYYAESSASQPKKSKPQGRDCLALLG